ncbi:MAG: hypothetical protein KKD21_12640 [Proteobacteria bacterium]|nr:hypothetical protein [Pseudomonadota bacterium]MBU1697869.1 hypothetical protein [Pseudomonadota bacterium]
MKKDQTDWIDICRVGTWTASDGQKVTLTDTTFDKIIRSYDPAVREVPLVLGHPKTDNPAFGWVAKLRRAGEILQAQFNQVSDKLKEMVSAGMYKKISIALFPDMTLRHIGLLGASQPAVSGMRNVKFNQEETYAQIEFTTSSIKPGSPGSPKKEDSKMDEKDQKIKELETQLSGEKQKLVDAQVLADQAKKDKEKSEASLAAFQGEQRKKAVEAKIDGLVEKNNILPADKPAISAIAIS